MTTVPVGLPEVKAPVEPVETQPLSVMTCWPSSLWMKAMKSFAASLRVALRGDVERAADGVGAVLDVVGRGLDAVDLHGLDGAVEGAEGDVADGGLVAGDGLHDDCGGAADLGGDDGLVDLVDLDAGQLDERAAGAGAFLTGDDGDGIAPPLPPQAAKPSAWRR